MARAIDMSDERDKSDRPVLRVIAGGSVLGRASPGRTSDETLLAAFLVGDDEAFGELIRRHERLVLSIVRRYARNADDARDLSQRTFLRAFEAARRTLRGGTREPFPFRRWVVRVAVNLAKNHLRDELRVSRAPLELLGLRESEPPSALDGLDRAERAATVRRAILRLPRRQREVLTLRIDAELPFAEIADALGLTENAVKVAFHHATRRLRGLVAPRGAGEESP